MIGNVTYKKLGEVLTVERGGSPRPIQAYLTDAEDGLNWIKIGDAIPGSKYITSTKEKIKPEGLKKTRFVHKGDFILSNSMSFGRPYILGIDGCIHDGWLVLHDENNVFDKSYLYYYLSSPGILAEFKRLAVGGVVNNLNSELVRNVKVAILPLEDQQRIVRELDAIHAILDAKNEQLRELDELAQAIFYDMFGDPITNEKGWEIKNLGDICLVKGRIGFRGYTRNDFVETAEEGAISLSPTNIINGHMDFSKCSYVTWDKYNESPEIIVREGDILLVKTGSSYGKCAYVDSLPHESTINPQFVVIKELKIDGRYLTAYLQSEAAKIKYEGFVLGTAIPTFSQKSLNSMPVLCPPLDLQQAFASKISAIEQQKELIRASITETETLLAARMQHYFD